MITSPLPESSSAGTPEGAPSQHAINRFCDEELTLIEGRDSPGAFLGVGEDSREALENALQHVTADGRELPDSAWDLLSMRTYLVREDNPYYFPGILQRAYDRSAQISEALHLDSLDYVVQTTGLRPINESFEIGIPDMPWVTVTAGYANRGYELSFSFFDGPPSDTEERQVSRQVLVDVYDAQDFIEDHTPKEMQTQRLLGLKIRDSADQDSPRDIHSRKAVSQGDFSEDIAETIDFCLTNAYVRALSRENERADVWDETNNTWVRVNAYGVPSAAAKLSELGISQLSDDGTPIAIITPDARDKDLHIKSARKTLATTTTYVPGYGGHVSVDAIIERLSPDKLAFMFPHLVDYTPDASPDTQQ